MLTFENFSQLKVQVGQGEEEAHALRTKIAALQAQLDAQKGSQKGAEKEDKTAQNQIAALEKAASEREKEIKQLRAEVVALKAAVAKAEEAAANARKESESNKKPAAPPPSSDAELKELRAKLKATEDKLAAAFADAQKLTKDLEHSKKAAEDLKKSLQTANSRVAALEAEVKPLESKLAKVEKDLAAAKDELNKVQGEVEGLRIRSKKQEEDLKTRDAKIVELEKMIKDFQALLDARNAADRSSALETELEALRVRCQAAEDVSHSHKMAATEAQAMASIAKIKAETFASQLTESQTTIVELRQRMSELEKAEREALARLVEIPKNVCFF